MIWAVYSVQNVQMSTQNGCSPDLARFHTKIMALWSFSMFVWGSHKFTMFSAHELREKRGMPILRAHIVRWRPLPDLLPDNFFGLSVLAHLKKAIAPVAATIKG